MRSLEYLADLRLRIIRILIVIAVIAFICMTFGIHIFDYGGFRFPILRPDTLNNVASQVIVFISDNLLPENVKLIQTAPGQAFFTEVFVAIMLGIILGIPVIVREITVF